MNELREKLESAKSGAESLVTFSEGEWYQDLARAIADTLTKAIDSLTPSLDENGLAACGCGGKPEYQIQSERFLNEVSVGCPKCFESSAHVTADNGQPIEGLKMIARKNWNTSHGYHD